jgi:methylated-DNA-[protein]-cysteine S-methyltransferase
MARDAKDGEEDLRFVVVDTPVGPVGLVRGGRGYRHVLLPGPGGKRAVRRRIREVAPGAREDPEGLADGTAAVAAWAEGKPVPGGLPLDYGRTGPFHRRVYGVLRRIRPGRTLTYGEVAAKAGSPGAHRSVGSALARNPLPILIPCHRVLRSGGGLGGFTAPGGLDLKERMLRLEGAL